MTVPRTPFRRGTAAAAALAVIALGTLGACSAGSADSTAAGDAGAAAQGPAATDDLAADADGRALADQASRLSPSGSAGSTGGAARVAVQTRAVISTGKVALRSKDLDAARRDLDRLIGRFGGYVADEKTLTDDDGVTSSSALTIRLPSARFDQLMAAFDDVAEVVRTSRAAQDVTTEVIDVDARIRTQEVSLQRLRTFLGRSSDIATVIRLEGEIARREADLASLRAQQDYLADQTSLATIDVTMDRVVPAAQQREDPLDDAGFLTGLRNGWNALLDVLVVVATVVGAVVPFTVVLLVVGAPLVLWARNARRRRTTSTPAADPVA